MSSASLRAGFFLVATKAERFLSRLVRLVTTFLSDLCLAVLRAIVTCVVFTTCVMVTLHYIGVPVPGPAELFDKIVDLERLTSILS